MKRFLKVFCIFLIVILFCAADAVNWKSSYTAMAAKKSKKIKAVKTLSKPEQAKNIDLSTISDKELLGLSLQAELSRSGSSNNDPVEREAVLREIIDRCSGTEEAENAYWSLADLYLDAFSEPKEEAAREILEKFLKNYPDSRWAVNVKCRLFALYDGKGDRAAELLKELERSGELPNIIKSNLRAYIKK